MIAAISPADYNYDETVGTLKYANRAKQIKNAPKINEDPKDGKLRELGEEIARLKKMLAAEGGDCDADSVEMEPFENKHGQAQQKGLTEAEKKKLSILERQDRQYNEQHNQLVDNQKQQDDLFAEETRKREELERKLKELEFTQVNSIATGALVQGISEEAKKELDGMERENKIVEEDQKKTVAAQKKKQKRLEVIDQGESLKEMQDKYQEMQKKYKQICYDVRDAERENYCAKEEYLESIRTCDRELDFLKQIATVLYSGQEIDQIREASTYNEEKDDYNLTRFFFQELGMIFLW